MEQDIVRQETAWALLKAFRQELDSLSNDAFGMIRMTWATDMDTGRAILASDPQVQVAVIRAAVTKDYTPTHWRKRHIESHLLALLARRTLLYSQDDLQVILHAINARERPFDVFPGYALIRSMAKSLRNPATIDTCRPELTQLRESVAQMFSSAEQRKFLKLIDEMLRGSSATSESLSLVADEWSEQVIGSLDQLDPAMRKDWEALLHACFVASGSAPSAKWLANARALRETLGMASFTRLAPEWLGAFRRSGNKPPEYTRERHQLVSRGCLLEEDNANLLRGLAWLCADVDDSALATTLADAAIAAYRKISGWGPRSPKIGSACVYTLKSMPGLHAVAQLERVRLNVKQPQFLKGIERALDEVAERAGLTRDDLVEMTVPTFDLAWRDGASGSIRRMAIGTAAAELAVTGMEVALRWYDANDAPRKNEPAEVRRDHKAELKDLKRLRDDITHMLTAQRDRIERLPLAQRQWTLPAWRERYLDHPLIGNLARRLIWRFIWKEDDGREQTEAGIWRGGRLVRADDTPLDMPEPAMVTLWHPVGERMDAVLAWRDWLERHQVTQPFKQAHREVYVLTDAERATRLYSNRFAAHILRQHQFNALCVARGWRNTLRLMVDDEYPPATLDLPQWNLRAEFWIEGAGDNYGTDTNETGTYFYLSTDQVRFYRREAAGHFAHASGGGYRSAFNGQLRDAPGEANAPINLEDIPPLVFSEALRDVDLFVGVASVGNDPTWQDGGPQGRYRDYWEAYSFGELSATAETRKQLLERLVPRLDIADRCTLEGRFLKIRGDLRTYKIHLGSGNILMEPNDQYLCIVQSRGAGSTASPGELFLPFEGDTVLALVLSKAFLLAADTKITDPTITRQINAK